jgi:hypothetical protein
MSQTFAQWRATAAAKFHSKPRATEYRGPMSQRAYAAAVASLTLSRSAR